MLSPYLRYRLIDEAEVVSAVQARHAAADVEKFISEVQWRTYWKGWLQMRPSIWSRYERELAALETQSGGWQRDYASALAANTGIDCFDAWIAELAEHGYLHNHARMWFASIWIFTLRLPWQLGAALFWRQLYDGDAASNTLSWRWVAGLQTVGKTYLARADNIARYTDGRFDPKGLATTASVIADGPMPAPVPIEPVETLFSGRAALLIGEDDFTPETLPLDELRIVAVAGLAGRYGRSDAVENFVTAARDDACARAVAAFGLDGPAPTLAGCVEIRDWARANDVTTLVVGYAPVGPGAAALAELGTAFSGNGITLIRVRRDWDSAAWPHAKRGFFAFREGFQV